MKSTTLLLAGAAGLLLTACIPSVNPFYTEKDMVFEAGLLGEWQTLDPKKEPQHWKFEKDDKAYKLTVRDNDGKEGQFKATLFRIKNYRFLDLIPTKCDYATNQADLVAFAMFPGHLLVHVAQVEPELTMAFCDFDWLGDYLKENPKALAHHRSDDMFVLTAETRKLQRFVLDHMTDDTLFSDYGELRRVATSSEAGTDATHGK